MEPDLDKDELIKPKEGELSGDRLLYSLYSSGASPQQRKKRVCIGLARS